MTLSPHWTLYQEQALFSTDFSALGNLSVTAQHTLTGKCPVSLALEGEVKGHNIKGKYLTGKPRL